MRPQNQTVKGRPRASNLTGPEGAGDTAEDPRLMKERATTDGDTVEDSTEEEPWCPPIPNTPDGGAATESESCREPTSLATERRRRHG